MSKFGKGVRGVFKPNKSDNSVSMEHSLFSFGFVYANELAKSELAKENPDFPVGSIIVREKNKTETSETPELVIAMVKQEKGFSKKTDDWEFFVFDGKDLQVQKREVVGSCSACHSNAKESDWVFRSYIKPKKGESDDIR